MPTEYFICHKKSNHYSSRKRRKALLLKAPLFKKTKLTRLFSIYFISWNINKVHVKSLWKMAKVTKVQSFNSIGRFFLPVLITGTRWTCSIFPILLHSEPARGRVRVPVVPPLIETSPFQMASHTWIMNRWCKMCI